MKSLNESTNDYFSFHSFVSFAVEDEGAFVVCHEFDDDVLSDRQWFIDAVGGHGESLGNINC